MSLLHYNWLGPPAPSPLLLPRWGFDWLVRAASLGASLGSVYIVFALIRGLGELLQEKSKVEGGLAVGPPPQKS